ncbi:hypothetical protein ACN47E_004482 [Coniothyrium glycines]
MAPFKVAVYLYTDADILDFSGPVEVFSCRSREGSALFEVTSFAHHDPIKSESGALVYKPNATFEEVSANIADYDILVVPGADFETISALIKSPEGRDLSALLRKFVSCKPRQDVGQRVLQSVCTGSILLAASGILANRTITTHHHGFEMLQQVADEAAGGHSNVNVVRKRWVDAGKTDAGVRIVNAGGVSSGIDASLWVVEEIAGKEAADWAAEVAEFERRDAGWGAV